MSTDSAISKRADVQQDFADFADIPGYDSARDAAVAYENSAAESVNEFHRNEVIRHLLSEQPDVAFDNVIDTDLYPGDSLITINDSDSMAVIRVDEVVEAVIIETGDSWLALEPQDVSNVIRSLEMAESHLEADR